MDEAGRRQLLEQYRSGYGAVVEALEGASDEDLDRRPGPHEWTAREATHHLADAEMRSAVRLRQLLAEDAAEIQGYDEAGYAKRLHYDRPIESAMLALRGARETNVELLDRLGEDDWLRAGHHSEHGRYAVEDWLRIYAAHCHDHAEQIRKARAGGE